MRSIIPAVIVVGGLTAPLFGQGGAPIRLTLQEAEGMALKNHPQVQAAQDVNLTLEQRIREARAAYYPDLNGEITGSQGNQQARIGAGFLTASRLFNRQGQGITLNQLITDSGRTSNLVAEAKFRSNASVQDYEATRYNVLLGVNTAYFDVLRAQGLIKVANSTVDARKLLVDQVTTLAANNLRSQLDVSFAQVNLAQAQLLLLRAQNQLKAAYAAFTRALGGEETAEYQLQEQELPPSPPADVETLVRQAVMSRPELAALRLTVQADTSFEKAERDLSYPTVSFMGVGGYMGYINQITLPRVIPNEYEGAAVNVQIPIFNGYQFSARREAAHYQTLEAGQRVRDLQQRVALDVRSAYANAATAYQALDVSAQFLRQATLAQSLAQGRYDLGLASIVELTQAQLNVTDAEIQNLSAKYDYQAMYAALQYATGALR